MYRITVDASDVIEEEILEPLTGNVPDICKADIYHMKKEDLKDLCRSVREGDCEVIAIDLEQPFVNNQIRFQQAESI